MNKLLISYLLCGFCSLTSVFSQQVLINDEKKLVNVGQNMLLYQDTTQLLDIHQINAPSLQSRFIPAIAEIPSFPTTTSAVWVKIILQNLTDERAFLQLTSPTIDSMEFYAFDIHNQLVKEKKFTALDVQKHQELKSVSFIFELPTHTHRVYLRLFDDENITLDVKTGSLYALYNYNDERVWWNAIYFGIIFIMLAYNFFLYINTLEISYLYYVGFSLTFALSYSHTQGFSHYLLGNLDWLLIKYSSIMPSISIALGSVFAMYFLQMKNYYPWARIVVYIMVGWSVLNILLNLLGFSHISFVSLQLSALLPIYFYLVIAYLTYKKKGYKPAIFYLIAFIGFEIMLTLHILVGRGAIPHFSAIANYLLHLGSAWELVVLSLALAYRINLLKIEKNQAQDANIQLIQQQNTVLETKINERTAKLNNVIEELNQINEQLNQNVILTKIQKEEISKQAEELKNANEKMQELDNFKEVLTGMIVHDLKNPLNTILGLGERQEVVQAGRQMLNMVMNILDVQKFEQAEFRLHLADYSLQNIVKEALGQVKLLIERKSLKVINTISPSLYVKVDIEITLRLFVNLLTNAIKYSPNNAQIEILSDLPEVVPPHDFTLICIKDYGEGIPQDKIDYIFDKFNQVKARKSGEVRSTGLGLTFCKMAVEAHGGKIDVISQVQQGTTFWFYLPKGTHAQESIADNYAMNDQPPIELNAKAKIYLKPYLIQLENFTVYEYSDVKNILNQMVFTEDESIQHWKKQLENALRACNEEKYHDLLLSVKG
jgi:signal transduction histidine kinase